jgi:hypothetical protein
MKTNAPVENRFFTQDSVFEMAIRVYETNYTLERISTEITYILSTPHTVDLPSWAVDHVHVCLNKSVSILLRILAHLF